MTSYRYLGYGTTDANGVAHYTYTGTGAGEVDVIASLDNPISQGSIVSETLPVFDCYKKDTGMSDYTNIWSVVNATLSRDGNYSTITESTTGTTGIIGISNVSLINYRIEVDVYQVDGTRDEWALQVVSSDYQDITFANAKLGEWKHISLDVTDAPINTRVRLATGGSCTELRFKNFMVYPNGDNDVISINASNPVIQSTETTNITGSLFIGGVLQKNTNIDVYKNGTKIDTINTGSSGVASYTYTGSGAGATEFQFKYGSILSETFALIDATWIDYATQENHKDVWYNHANTHSERKSEYTELTENGGNLIYRLASQYGFSKENICIEYDIFQVDGISANGTSGVFNSNGSVILSNPLSGSNMNIGEWNHMKLEFQGSNGVKINGTLRSYASAPTDNLLFGFLTNGDCTTVRFKNVAIYPI